MEAQLRKLPIVALLLVPGALVVYMSFNAGGFFPRQPAIAALVLAQMLVLYVSLAPNPFARLSWPAVVTVSAMALFALWVLLSQTWSDAPGRSIIEFDRALMYLLLLVLFTLLGGSARRLRFAVRGVAVAVAIVGISALITRLLPDVWHTAPNLQNQRLSFPLTYWNALGILVAMGVVLCFHLACDVREHPVVRVLGAAAVPALATTVMFTFSRGPTLGAFIGLLAYVLVARPRGLLTGAIATVPFAYLALHTAWEADLLATTTPTTPAAQAQGHHVFKIVLACMAGAAVLRAILLLVDARRPRTIPEYIPQRARQIAAGALAAAALIAVVGLAVNGSVSRGYHRVVTGTDSTKTGDFRKRLSLSVVGSPGRVEQYRAALDGYRDQSLHGNGAGTYELTWAQYRPRLFQVVDAHSIYIESLSETGLVGAALIVMVILSLLGTLAARSRGPDRAVYGAVCAAGIAWALHAGIDWDWEMPATTIPLIALGGLGLGSARSRLSLAETSADTRLALGLACLASLIVPILVIGSQGRMNDGITAYQRGSCDFAMSASGDSMSWLAVRSEPYQVMAYCNLQRGFPVPALDAMRTAHRYDPRSWETDAGLAVMKAFNGRDPRADIARAVRLNPKVTGLQDVQRELNGTKPSEWRDHAGAASRDLLGTGELTVQNPY